MAISFSPQPARTSRTRGAGVTAVLGPTNTGKTHLAIERMLAHSSGVIGLPLRLLAREVYNKVADRAGKDAVALITGEEKIKPPNPRFWVSTVEAMPRDLNVAFLAVDEIQLGADFERGHVFTDRMLMRGRARKPWSSVPPPCVRWSKNCCPERTSSAGHGYRRSPIRVRKS
jgi:ATP-dependent RNA helicase SUPV3L1/SUV3